MSDIDYSKTIQISKEIRRKFQYNLMQAWLKGRITGRECIQEIVELESVIYLPQKEVTRLRSINESTVNS